MVGFGEREKGSDRLKDVIMTIEQRAMHGDLLEIQADVHCSRMVKDEATVAFP